MDIKYVDGCDDDRPRPAALPLVATSGWFFLLGFHRKTVRKCSLTRRLDLVLIIQS